MEQGRFSEKRTIREPKNCRKKWGTTVFYSFYVLMIVAFAVGLYLLLGPLKQWLTEYEASQPNYARDQVFETWFCSRNWQALYEKAEQSETLFEGAQHYALYMEQRVGQQELRCVETSAGLSGNKKYIVKAGNDKLATFTLFGGSDFQLEIAHWELGQIELFYRRDVQITVEKYPGQTVYVNGKPLDESYTIQKTTTVAEEYLPEGLHGYRMEVQQVKGLLAMPKVELETVGGARVALADVDGTGHFVPEAVKMLPPTAEEYQRVREAMEAYGRFMIKKAGKDQIAAYFNEGSSAYRTIVSSETGWVQSFASFNFTEPEYSGFYRYSQDCFSLSVDMTLQVVRGNGSIKAFPMRNTLLLQKNDSGELMVIEMTNVDLQQQNTQVRLTFKNGDELLQSEMLDAQAKIVHTPTLAVPEGMVFRGWVRQDQDDNGKQIWTVIFDTMGDVPRSGNLEPMELFALFEKEET